MFLLSKLWLFEQQKKNLNNSGLKHSESVKIGESIMIIKKERDQENFLMSQSAVTYFEVGN